MIYLILIYLLLPSLTVSSQDDHVPLKRTYSTVAVPTVQLPASLPRTEVSQPLPQTQTILASTLDGTLIAIDKRSGTISWSLVDQPVVKSPYNPMKPVLPAFLPDPKDGTLYMMGASMKEPLKKLPFTIPELVAASPSKTADGILYSGKKIDTWFSVNRATGAKQGSLSYEGCLQGAIKGEDDICPKTEPGNFLIGRTEYNIMMYDTTTKGRRWNVSYYDYSSNLGGIDISKDYDLAHFTDSSTGAVVTLDKETGAVQWSKQFSSPIVAMYQIDGDSIASVPFTSVSVETLENLVDQFNAPERDDKIGETKLYPTLYVGEHEHGLFAVPSLVDEETLMISPANNGPLLLEGPRNVHVPSEIELDVIARKDHGGTKDGTGQRWGTFTQEPIPKDKSSVLLFDMLRRKCMEKKASSNSCTRLQHVLKRTQSQISKTLPKLTDGKKLKDKWALLIGYYQVPEFNSRSVRLSSGETPMQLTSSQTMFPFQVDEVRVIDSENSFHGTSPRTDRPERNESGRSSDNDNLPYDIDVMAVGWRNVYTLNTTYIFSHELIHLFSRQIIPFSREKLSELENKELKFIAVFIVMLSVWMVRFLKKQFKDWEIGHRGSWSGSASRGSSSSFTNYEATAVPVELEAGEVKVGNITFDPNKILGKGCEGTFVYKGRFDGRDVAVKRVLAACFSIADREVDLLRESDEHPNVVRYFCMEQCKQFRYIALELCVATLQDYVEGRYEHNKLDVTKVFLQAVQGVAYLHSLDIAHRDIKPQNVLISVPNRRGEVRAMISDFGLCKKLKVGRMSFSRRSGVAGTEGWIAPEMLLGHRSTTCMVDIFSMGCLYYYLLTKGKHPFGENFHRQANILSNQYKLAELDEEKDCLVLSLTEKMLSKEPTDRPPALAVLKHPVFWSKDKILTFLQDVSDRVEKEEGDSALLAVVERGGKTVTRGDWREFLDTSVATDLRKHRAYNGRSVRDLLRALRNKKHHFRELTDDIKHHFGDMPGDFTNYWTSRFPRLLLHTYTALQCCKYENTFCKYYDKDYDFLQPPCDLCYNVKNLSNNATAEKVGENLDDDCQHEAEMAEDEITQQDEDLHTVKREPYFGPATDRRYSGADLFQPRFLAGDTRDPRGVAAGDNRDPRGVAEPLLEVNNEESQSSVVSEWDQLDTSFEHKQLGKLQPGRHDRAEYQQLGQGHHHAVQAANQENVQPDRLEHLHLGKQQGKPQGSQLEQGEKVELHPCTREPHKDFNSLFSRVTSSPNRTASPTVRRAVAQLRPDRPPSPPPPKPTWAQAVRNIQPAQPVQNVQPVHAVQDVQPAHAVQNVQPAQPVQNEQAVSNVQPSPRLQPGNESPIGDTATSDTVVESDTIGDTANGSDNIDHVETREITERLEVPKNETCDKENILPAEGVVAVPVVEAVVRTEDVVGDPVVEAVVRTEDVVGDPVVEAVVRTTEVKTGSGKKNKRKKHQKKSRSASAQNDIQN